MKKKIKADNGSLKDLLSMFEDSISIADINSSRYLAKISAAIVQQRIELQMTQNRFAEYLGVSQGMVSKWEGGDYNFSIKALAEIAEKLDLELYINLKPSGRKINEYYVEHKGAYIYAKDEDTTFNNSNIIMFNSKKNSKKLKKISNFELMKM